MGTRFLFYPVFSGIGAIFYFSYKIEPSFIDSVLFFVLCSGLYYLSRHKWSLHVGAIFLFCFSFGFLLAKIEAMRMHTVMLGSDVTTEITARVISFEQTARNRTRLLLDVETTQSPKLFYAPKRVRLSARVIPEGLAIGDTIRGRARLRAASGPIRPGNYDFAFHDYFRGIGAQGFFISLPSKTETIVPLNLMSSIEISVARIRLYMTTRITNTLPGEEGAIAAALITGQRGGISEQNNHALRVSGLSHILSISGLHMAMVTGMVLVVLRSILALFPVWSSHFPAKKIAAFIALFISAFYLLLSGSDVAAQRSFIMVAVMLIAVLLNRAAITMHNLAIAALITIIFVPHEIVGPSFQMSFAATAALIAAFGWWSKRKASRDQVKGSPIFVGGRGVAFLLLPLISTVVASLLAGGASGIYSAYHFSNTAPLGVISNAVVFPVMSIVVMPFALLAAILIPLGLEWLPLQVMGWGVKFVLNIALWVTSISPDFNPGLISNNALLILSVGLIILLFMQTWMRLVGVLILACGLIIIIFQKTPFVVITEDSKLAAVIIGNHEMAVNKKRQSQFIMKNWREAYGINKIILPNDENNKNGFFCSVDGCRARFDNDKIFAIIITPKDLGRVCRHVDIAFLDFVVVDKRDCSARVILTKRELSLYGTAEISKNYKVRWAVGAPVRPWNSQRIYSRHARGF